MPNRGLAPLLLPQDSTSSSWIAISDTGLRNRPASQASISSGWNCRGSFLQMMANLCPRQAVDPRISRRLSRNHRTWLLRWKPRVSFRQNQGEGENPARASKYGRRIAELPTGRIIARENVRRQEMKRDISQYKTLVPAVPSPSWRTRRLWICDES